jgi:nucleotidyltransferase/DNA polymerase involved in DNA repair
MAPRRYGYVLRCCKFNISLIFYYQIEIRNDPSLEGKPVAVGDSTMIQTANYIARKFGVKSGLPGFIAKKLCPELQFVKPNMETYKQVSQELK